HSGNRGACAACCRIAWEDEKSKSKKSYFSMKDLSLSEYIKTLEKYGVAALKIEGRLKNANWVKNITSIYRQILDGAIDDDEQSKLKNELKKYSARETHSGHIIGHKNLVGENAHWDDYIKTTDDYAIPDIFTDNIKIKIETNEKTVVSVYLKDQSSKFEFKAPVLPKKARPAQLSEIITKIKELNKNMETVVELSDNEAVCSPSYLNELTDKIKAELKNLEKKSEKYADLSAELNKIIYPDKTEIQRPALFGSMPDKLIIRSDQISFFNGNKIDFVKTLVIYLYKELNIDLVSQISKKYDIIFAIPDVIFEKDIDFITATIDKLIKAGYKKFQSNSFDGMEILKKYNCEKSAGLGSAIMNHIAPKFYQEFGYSSFYAPVESDVSILKSLSSFVDQKIECLVYGKIPLFISRVEEDCYKANKFRDKYIELESYKINELYYFVTSKPLCFIGEIFKKENIKFDSLTADMRFFDNPYLKVLDLKNNKPQIDKDYSFNFFRKLV
ncbi:MAG: U32 family peptidase, partial [Spirochaetes bacterium]|nr:U32 family peptidase [Spirochaetota bacterium]